MYDRYTFFYHLILNAGEVHIQMAIRSAVCGTEREWGIILCGSTYYNNANTYTLFGSFHSVLPYLKNHLELQLHCDCVRCVRHNGQWYALN